MASFASLKSAIFDREEKKQQYQTHIRGLNAYDRHKKFIKDYVGFYGKENSSHVRLPVKTDQDTLREGYRFIRSEEDDMDTSWEQRLVKRYYDKLFKECAKKLHYKRQKEKEEFEKRERGEYGRKRNRAKSDDDIDNEGSKEKKRKGKKTLASASDCNVNDDDEDHFDEFLEGMFP